MNLTKKLVSLLLATAICLTCMVGTAGLVSAADETEYSLENGVLTVNAMGSYTGENAPWYNDRESITSAVINADRVGSFAFLGCVNLTEVTLADTVDTVESSAFYGCSSLTKIDLSNVTAIGSHAFHGSGLTTVVLNEKLKSVEAGAFYQCALTQIQFTGAYPGIAADAFTDVVADAYYPAGDASWTEDKLQNYGGDINWQPAGEIKTYTGSTNVATYPSLQFAVSSYDSENEYIKLAENVADVNVTLTQDLYIDLSGNSLSGTIVTNGHKVYGIDSTTDKYTCENVGYFDIEDENGNAVTPEKHFKTSVTGSVRRYYAVETDGKWSFHRIYLGITSVLLKPGDTGFGYKAVFGADTMVLADLDKEATFGYGLWLGDDDTVKKHQVFNSAEEFKTGDYKTLLLKNIDIANYGETSINAEVYLKMSDGTLIDSADYKYTMKDMVELVDTNWLKYEVAQQNAIVDMYLRNVNAMSDWAITNIKNVAETAE